MGVLTDFVWTNRSAFHTFEPFVRTNRNAFHTFEQLIARRKEEKLEEKSSPAAEK